MRSADRDGHPHLANVIARLESLNMPAGPDREANDVRFEPFDLVIQRSKIRFLDKHHLRVPAKLLRDAQQVKDPKWFDHVISHHENHTFSQSDFPLCAEFSFCK